MARNLYYFLHKNKRGTKSTLQRVQNIDQSTSCSGIRLTFFTQKSHLCLNRTIRRNHKCYNTKIRSTYDSVKSDAVSEIIFLNGNQIYKAIYITSNKDFFLCSCFQYGSYLAFSIKSSSCKLSKTFNFGRGFVIYLPLTFCISPAQSFGICFYIYASMDGKVKEKQKKEIDSLVPFTVHNSLQPKIYTFLFYFIL